jgi:cardiolipin synthase
MVHAKTAVADGCWSRIGSSNSNLASWVSNRELDVTISDPAFAAEMEAMFEHDMTNCTEIFLQPGRSGITRPRAEHDSPPTGPRKTRASRFAAGALGIGSTLRATFTQTRTLGPGELFILLGAAAALLALTLLTILLPKLIAWPLAAIFLWSAIAMAIHAAKLWRHRNET